LKFPEVKERTAITVAKEVEYISEASQLTQSGLPPAEELARPRIQSPEDRFELEDEESNPELLYMPDDGGFMRGLAVAMVFLGLMIVAGWELWRLLR
jgi:hypothetical protein